MKTIGVLAPKVMEHHRGTLLDRAAKAGLEIEAIRRAVAEGDRFLRGPQRHLRGADAAAQPSRPILRSACKDEPVGRTLDFLLQELFRETNTIGNKANFLAISQIVVAMKTELEKLREQVQNIE